ncbi:uncharacterized protein LOC142172155 [Nicotiana tabacum]|uniref:Uncharacterized protein LOC142172155 n=1 Tax=Nicotiana tabacum TaxID=4097 RepID=A0AC58T473_TOBAC
MAESIISYTHPLYLGPADTPCVVLIPVKLTGSENYGLWSRTMKIALLGKRKLGFVNGTCTKESCTTELQEQWETCNAIVLSWLMNTVSTELLYGIVYASNAHLVWEDLRERFDKDNSRDYVDHLEQQRLLQFLSGLNYSYDQARRQILMKSNVSSINQAYAMVIEDESRQCLGMGAVIDKNKLVAMQVGRNQSYKGKKPFVQCEHCGYKGHSKENFYKLIG